MRVQGLPYPELITVYPDKIPTQISTILFQHLFPLSLKRKMTALCDQRLVSSIGDGQVPMSMVQERQLRVFASAYD